jgi:predicted ribosome quality control (RQC) complex YloA/Tae2 family protein
MQHNIDLVQAKRTNILIAFACAVVLLGGTLYFLNQLANKIITSLDSVRAEYRPLVAKIEPALENSKQDIEKLSNSGSNALNTLSAQIPTVTQVVTESVEGVKGEYSTAKTDIIKDYSDLKGMLKSEYTDLKAELIGLKDHIRNDVAWMKCEVKKWRTLITFAIAIFGVLAVLVSIRDILDNVRWLFSLFTRSLRTTEHVQTRNR